MNRLVRALFFIMVIFIVSGYGQSIKKRATIDVDMVRHHLREYREEYGIPGAAAVVVTSKSFLSIATDGVRKLGEPDSIQVDDRFHIGSNTKAMTGFMAAALVEKGLINWNTRIIEVFPEFAESSRAVYNDKTLKDLLSHRARIMPFTSGGEFAQLPEFEGEKSERRRAFAGWLLQQEPVEIDTVRGYVYSNAGYGIAAVMLEKVSGKSWEQLITDELFTPLGIDGRFGWPAYDDADQPWGHYYETDSQRVFPHDPHDEYQLPDIASAAGDVSVSILDYGKFLQANLIGLSGKDTVLTAATYEVLHLRVDSMMQYAVGWGLREHEGYKVSRHNGSAGTFYCTALVFRDKDLALGIMMNGITPEAEKALADLRVRIMEDYLE
ncbi:MAG: beta-lactamase family protein [candidate division WOR-3 bacterium]|nr:MAG: beta-lactamase family protein [candidate division WOR-3 bacterium]